LPRRAHIKSAHSTALCALAFRSPALTC
jgi:hypothetical protein